MLEFYISQRCYLRRFRTVKFRRLFQEKLLISETGTHPIDRSALVSTDADPDKAADDDALEVRHEAPPLESVPRQPDHRQFLLRLYLLRFLLLGLILLAIRLRLGFGGGRRRR